MKKLECPVCEEVSANSAPAVVSPWIRELGVRTILSRYFLCSSCGTGYFSKRYKSVEMEYIYKNYRGLDYLEKRTKWEPWYSQTYNENHNSKNWILSRVQSLEQFLRKHIHGEIQTILDVGGDNGQYIPDIAEVRIVLDLSEKELMPGVQRIGSLDDISTVDLIVYAHVLEHVAKPLKEVEKLLEKTRYIYIEVPFGVPVINNFRKNQFRFATHLISSFNKKVWKSRTMPATGREVSSKRMLSQSEHLTFFTESSIERLALNLGAELIMEKGLIQTPDYQEASVLQCLLFRV